MRQENTLPTVTVAVSALNEKKNITAFLESVFIQREMGFVLERVIIISDGSTDNTVAYARALPDARVEVWEHSERIGKSSRLNELYAVVTSDILVQSDADVVFAHPYVIRDIIAPLIFEKGVGMCGGHPTPVQANTFTEKAVNLTAEAYIPLRKTLRGGNNVLSVDGRILAYKKELIKKITVPEDMIANDMYTYFCCLTKGYAYRYVRSAVVYYRSPMDMKDQIRQNTRFASAPARMKRHFSEALVSYEYHIPRRVILPRMIKVCLRHPILAGYIFVVNQYCKIKALFVEKHLTARWNMAWSTKRIHYNKK